MSTEGISEFDTAAEVDRHFDDSSIPQGERPCIVFLMGGVASGKTTIRKERYATGYVVVDAAEIFLSLSRGEYYPFPKAFEAQLNMIGGLVARQAISERRRIVVELIGMDRPATQALFDAMQAIGYLVSVVQITCDPAEAWTRNVNRGESDVSCYFAEPFHRRWLLEAATLTSD